jgi:hypothetical protein
VPPPILLLPSDPGLSVADWLALPVEWLDPATLVFTRHNGVHDEVLAELAAWPNRRPVWVHQHSGVRYVRDGRHRVLDALRRDVRIAARVHRTG